VAFPCLFSQWFLVVSRPEEVRIASKLAIFAPVVGPGFAGSDVLAQAPANAPEVASVRKSLA